MVKKVTREASNASSTSFSNLYAELDEDPALDSNEGIVGLRQVVLKIVEFVFAFDVTLSKFEQILYSVYVFEHI